MLDFEKILISLKIKIGGSNFFWKQQNPKRGQKQWFYLCVLILSGGSEEPSETNVLLQSRVRFSFTLLFINGFCCRFLRRNAKNLPMWHVTHGVGWTFSQNFGSLALTIWDLWCLEDREEKDQTVIYLITMLFVEQPRLHLVC